MKKAIIINKNFSKIISIFKTPIIPIMFALEIGALIVEFISEYDLSIFLKHEHLRCLFYTTSITNLITPYNSTIFDIIAFIIVNIPRLLTIVGLGLLYFSAISKNANTAKISLKCLITANLIDVIIYLLGFLEAFFTVINIMNPFFYIHIFLIIILYIVYTNLFSDNKYKLTCMFVFSMFYLILIGIAYCFEIFLFSQFNNIEIILINSLTLLFFTLLLIMLFLYNKKMNLIVKQDKIMDNSNEINRF